jgi:diguanylate cyclase (GGDEF)-like protein
MLRKRPVAESGELNTQQPALPQRFINGVFRNILAIKRVRKLEAENRRLRYENNHDDLSGLLNRKGVLKELDERIKLGVPTGVMVVDINNFKAYNSRFGHIAGNTLLTNLGGVLSSLFSNRKDEGVITASRFGGDEFVIIVDPSDRGQDDGLTPLQRIQGFKEYANGRVQEFFDNQGETVRDLELGISIGTSIYDPNNPVTIEALLEQADLSMYQEKKSNQQTT